MASEHLVKVIQTKVSFRIDGRNSFLLLPLSVGRESARQSAESAEHESLFKSEVLSVGWIVGVGLFVCLASAVALASALPDSDNVSISVEM